MKHRINVMLSAAVLISNLVGAPSVARAQAATPQEHDGAFYFGSVVLSLLYAPVKLATCLGTQATAAVVYTATYGVAGNYDGGTNGKDIGEVARRSCAGPWVITPEQVKKDYGN